MPDISSLFCDLMRNVTNPSFANNLLFEKKVNKELWLFLFAKPFINQSTNTVDNVFCNGCEENCYMPVEPIRKYDDTLIPIIDCDKRDNIGYVELDESEIRPNKFNMLAFCNSLSEVIQSNDEAKTLIPDLFYKIGRCQIKGSGYTLFLAINLKDESKIKNNTEYKNAVKPVIISINEIPDKTTLPCVLIDSVIYVDKNQDFGIFNDSITSLYQEKDTTDKNIFKKEGNNWQVSFNSKQVWVKHTKGCYYIAELLKNPNKKIKAKDLQAIVDKFELPDEQYNNMSEEELKNEGITSQINNSIDIIDFESLTLIKKQLKTIDTDIEEAEKNGMTQKLTGLKSKKAKIEDFIKKDTNLRGQSRKFSNSNKKVSDAVSSAIRTALKNIEREIPELSLHLKAHISTGHICSYKPDKNYEWSANNFVDIIFK